jgi:ABC-type nitrate/sulfonate/bicarbonate transport system substrate-binding protein
MAIRKLVVGAGAARFNWLPVFVAERLGLFANYGLEIEIVRTGAVDKATQAVLDGSMDLAITPPEGAIKNAASGGLLRIIAGNTNSLPLTLIARPDFSTVESLRGARLGTSSLTEGTAIYTMEMLRAHSLNYPADYSFEVVGVHPARWQALQDGRIDAAVQPAPLNFVAIDQGYNDLGEVSDFIPEIVFTAMIVRADRIPSIRAQLTSFLRAVREGTRVIYSGESDPLLADILEQIGESDAEHAIRAVEYMRSKRTFPIDLSIPNAAFSTSVRLMTEAGLLAPTEVEGAANALDFDLLRSLDQHASRAGH